MVLLRSVLTVFSVSALLAACSTPVGGDGSVGPPRSPAGSSSRPAEPATVTVTASASASATPTAVPLTFSQIYAIQKSGVVRIETVGCADAGLGTGFLLSPRLVATVAHIVDQSVVVSLIVGNQRTTGTVIGIDRTHDLALVRPARPLTGHTFRFSLAPPAVGDPVAAIGFPYGDPLTLTQGHISGLNRRIPVDSQIRTGLIETDTAINPGNSGGPLVAADGTVVGLVDAGRTNANGIGYAVAGTLAANTTTQWANSPATVARATCTDPLGPSQAAADVPTPDQIDNQTAAGITAAFNTYFDGINTGNYAAAYAVFSPQARARFTLASFAQGDATSYDSDISVLDAQQFDATTVRIALSFTSLQRADKAPNNSGDTCDNWTLTYTMIRSSDRTWLIDATSPYQGSTHTTC